MGSVRYFKPLVALCLMISVSTAYAQAPTDAIDWANISKEQLSLLEPAAFHQLTEMELASIPPQARTNRFSPSPPSSLTQSRQLQIFL
jgi:hypothetical protein